jgi:hypothetical protein
VVLVHLGQGTTHLSYIQRTVERLVEERRIVNLLFEV